MRAALPSGRVESRRPARERLAADPVPPMSSDNVEAEIDAWRAKTRRALILDNDTALSELLWGGAFGRLVDGARGWQSHRRRRCGFGSHRKVRGAGGMG